MIFRLMIAHPELESSLAQAWSLGNEDTVVAALKNLRSDASWQHKETLSLDVFDILQETKSSRVRNAAALTLVDLGIDKTTMMIVDILRRTSLAKVCGTLLFALSEIGASIPLDIIVEIIKNGSFEARNQAMFFLEERRFDRIEPHLMEETMKRLEDLINSDNKEAVEAANWAVHYLSNS